MVDLGIGEMVEDGSVAVVEWGDAAASLFGHDTLTVELTVGPSDEQRIVTLTPAGSWSGRRPLLVERLRPWTDPADAADSAAPAEPGVDGGRPRHGV